MRSVFRSLAPTFAQAIGVAECARPFALDTPEQEFLSGLFWWMESNHPPPLRSVCCANLGECWEVPGISTHEKAHMPMGSSRFVKWACPGEWPPERFYFSPLMREGGLARFPSTFLFALFG